MPAAVSTHHARAEPALIPVVVDDGGYARADTPTPRGGLEIAAGRQRVPTSPGDGVVAEFVVEGDIDRAG